MKTIIFVGILAAFSLIQNADAQSIEISFEADNNGQTVSLDSVLVKNTTTHKDTMLRAPYLSLMLDTLATGVNIPEQGIEFSLSPGFPNPFPVSTSIRINLPEKGLLNVSVTDIPGRKLAAYNGIVDAGTHSFTLKAARAGYYFITACYREMSLSQKVLCLAPGNGMTGIILEGPATAMQLLKQGGRITDFDYDPGDKLLMIGFAGSEESGITDSPETSKLYVFQFAYNIPCPGLDSLYYWGRHYHTVQIFSQCWMKENLEAGTLISGSELPSDNGIIEKYCYGDNQANCTAKGGLYLWDEMMQYVTDEGTIGICPDGWHIPTDEEWKVLEGVADSQYNIGSPQWNLNMYRGYDAGENLKATFSWYGSGNGIDSFGFTAVSTGYWYDYYFSENLIDGVYWTSSRLNNVNPYMRGMNYQSGQIARTSTNMLVGTAVRCLKDLD